MTEKIELGETRDGFQIIGFVTRTSAPHAGWVILVHQVDADHTEFDRLTRKLVAAGLNTLALDLRGHGDSTVRASGRPRVVDQRSLTPHDWRRTYRDVALAVKFVRAQHGGPVALLGSSIGASAVLYAVARDERLQGQPLVLLSPGLNYRGVDLKEAWAKVQGAPILVVHAAFDGPTVEFRRWVVDKLQDTTTRFLTVDGDAHGSKLLAQTTGKASHLSGKIVYFLTSHLTE